MVDTVLANPETFSRPLEEDFLDLAAKTVNLGRYPDKAQELLNVILEQGKITLLQFNSVIETSLKTRRFDEAEATIQRF